MEYSWNIHDSSQLKHKNVVEFLGVVHKSEKIFLVMELMDTDLRKVATRLSIEEDFRVAKQIAEAMYEMLERNQNGLKIEDFQSILIPFQHLIPSHFQDVLAFSKSSHSSS